MTGSEQLICNPPGRIISEARAREYIARTNRRVPVELLGCVYVEGVGYVDHETIRAENIRQTACKLPPGG